jgi:Flp pilus assembly protein TadG
MNLPARETLAQLLTSDRGTSVVELAIAAPVLLLFLAAVTDLGGGFTARYKLQQVVNRSLEMAQNGTYDGDYSYLAVEAAAAAEVPTENAVVEQWIECGGNSTKRAWTDDCPSGTPARYVKLTVTSSYRPLFAQMPYLAVQSDGTIKQIAHATLRVR